MKRILATLIQIIIVAVLFLMLISSVKADGITGQVVAPDGSGVSGIIITCRIDNLFPPKVAKSDANGLFTFDGLHDGKYLVQLSSAAFLFDEPQKTVTLTAAKRKVSVKFYAIPLPASVVPPQISRITDADVISVQWFPQPGEPIGKTMMLSGVSAAYTDKDVLKIEWKDGHTPGLFPLCSLRWWGYVPQPPQ